MMFTSQLVLPHDSGAAFTWYASCFNFYLHMYTYMYMCVISCRLLALSVNTRGIDAFLFHYKKRTQRLLLPIFSAHKL